MWLDIEKNRGSISQNVTGSQPRKSRVTLNLYLSCYIVGRSYECQVTLSDLSGCIGHPLVVEFSFPVLKKKNMTCSSR